MKALVGVAAADEVFEFWATDHYTWIYQTVLTDEGAIAAVLEEHDLQID